MAAVSELDPGEALRELLSAWRQRKQPELAARIEALSARLGEARPDPEGKRVKDKVARWDELAKVADPADFEPLARSLFLTNGGADVGGRLLALAEWPPDPRLATLLHTLALRVAYTATSARPFYKALFQALERVADPRTLEVLPQIEARFEETFAQREDYRGYLARQCAKLRVAIAATGAPSSLTAADRATLDAVDAWLARADRAAAVVTSLDELYDLVYADPEADEPRAVLADALQERGDPRGELIALQLLPEPTPQQKRREKQLLGAHADGWVGPLADWTLKKGRAFERGFLARCNYARATGQGSTEPPVTREWSTVREVEGEGVPAAVIRQMPGVTHVGGLALADLPTVGHGAPLASLCTLRARGAWTPDLVETIGSLPALPGLKRLRIDVIGVAQVAPTARDLAALARALERLSALRLNVPPFEDVCLELGPRVLRIHFNNAGYTRNPALALQRLGDLARDVRDLASLHLVVHDYRPIAEEVLLAPFPLEQLQAATGLPVTREAVITPASSWEARQREI